MFAVMVSVESLSSDRSYEQVAKMLKETAEVYEKEGSYKEAVEAFQQVEIAYCLKG